MRYFNYLVMAILVLGMFLCLLIAYRYGSQKPTVERSLFIANPMVELEKIADLEHPPGNIAISKEGRIFFSFHPEGEGDIKVAELVDNKPVAFPNLSFQVKHDGKPYFDQILSLRVDAQNRLWTLDLAHHGWGQPRLLAFDIKTKEIIHQFDIPARIAGLGSHMNDFHITKDGKFIFIADASIFAKTPAIIVYDIEKKTARRLLENHPSVAIPPYYSTVEGRKMVIWGIFAIRPGVDSIAIDQEDKWLYFAPVTAAQLYRVRVSDLVNENLDNEALGQLVEVYTDKTPTDGMIIDNSGNLYVTDPDHSAIHFIPSGKKDFITIAMGEKLRWPDGLAIGPDGFVYVTCSALHKVIMTGKKEYTKAAPFQIFRFDPLKINLSAH